MTGRHPVGGPRAAWAVLALALGAGCEPEPAMLTDSGDRITADAGRADSAIVDTRGADETAASDALSVDHATSVDAQGGADVSSADTAQPDTSIPPNQPPVAEITAPASGTTVHQGVTVSFAASCLDPDGDEPLAHQWTLSDGSSRTSAVFELSLAASGAFSARYRCTDARGASSAEQVRSVIATNTPPTLTWVEPADNAILLAGTQLTLAAGCDDVDDPAGWHLEWSQDGVPLAGTGGTRTVSLDSPTTAHVYQVRCADPFGLDDTAVRTLQVVAPPAALYLSTENQLAYQQVLWAPTPGQPVVVNQPLFAPGGAVWDFALAGGDVFYSADHTIVGRQQLFRANPLDRHAPAVVTPPPAQGSVGNLRTSPDGNSLAFTAQQDVAGQTELLWVDATAASPQAVHLNPPLGSGEDVIGYLFSHTGRYLAFWTRDTSADIYVVDLATGDAAVPVLLDVTPHIAPVAFADDDSLAVVASSAAAYALDLATLQQPAPHLVQFFATGTNRLSAFAFVGSGSLVAYVARGTSSGALPRLRLVDAAAALSGVDELNVEVFADAAVEGAGSVALRVCGDVAVFSAEVNTSYHELFEVDLVQWAADYRQLPGSQVAPVRLNAPYSGAENAYLQVAAFDPTCSALVYAERLDDDGDLGTPEVNALRLVDFSSAGDPRTFDVGGDYTAGGLYPNLGFSPDGQVVYWTRGILDHRTWLSPVAAVDPLEVAATLPGQIDDVIWLDGDRLLVVVEGSDDAGLYLWDRSSPTTPTRLSPEVADTDRLVLTADRSAVIYRADFSSTVRRVARAQLAVPGASVTVHGDGVANAAQVNQALLIDAGPTVVFRAVHENLGQGHAYAVDLDAPGVVTGLTPAEGDPGASVASSLVYSPATDLLVYRIVRGGRGALFTTELSGPGAPVEQDLAPAESVLEILAVAPSGDHVLYTASLPGAQKTYLRSLVDGSPAVEVSAVRATSTFKSVFSPSGRYGVFFTSGSPARAYLVDTQDLTAGVAALTPESLPGTLPYSPDDPRLAQTQGSRAVAFADDETWVYLAYDDTYAAHLKLVRKPLPALDVEVPVSGPVADGDQLDLWSASDGAVTLVYSKLVAEASGGTRHLLLAVDGSAPGVERTLSPLAPATDLDLVSFELHGDTAAMRIRPATSTLAHLYVASLDGSRPAWQVHPALASDDGLRVVGVSSIGGSQYVAYAAQHQAETAPRLHIARNLDGVVRWFDVGPEAPDTVVAEVSPDGRWLWTAPVVGGASLGLQLMALSGPGTTPLRVSGVPIASGRVDLPVATR